MDNLIGLKENVIIGKLIPVGTGMKRYRNTRLNTDETQTISFEELEPEGMIPEESVENGLPEGMEDFGESDAVDGAEGYEDAEGGIGLEGAEDFEGEDFQEEPADAEELVTASVEE